jgi:hypothetical protein
MRNGTTLTDSIKRANTVPVLYRSQPRTGTPDSWMKHSLPNTKVSELFVILMGALKLFRQAFEGNGSG